MNRPVTPTEEGPQRNENGEDHSNDRTSFHSGLLHGGRFRRVAPGSAGGMLRLPPKPVKTR